MCLRVRLGLSVLVLLGALWQLIALVSEAKTREVYAYEQAELHHAKHELLNPSAWVKIGSKVVSNQVDDFEMTPGREERLRGVIKIAVKFNFHVLLIVTSVHRCSIWPDKVRIVSQEVTNTESLRRSLQKTDCTIDYFPALHVHFYPGAVIFVARVL